MKTKDKTTLRTKSLNELKDMAISAQDLLSELNLSKSQNKLKNTRQIFLKRKELAQILTIIREKELLEGLRT
ncbi:MAG: 50S ribosomal protein L29 [Candidatus Levybacteria bacterium]|nr:50S ribosomal protein L29 [Candidatus Levybacteria bacterium]